MFDAIEYHLKNFCDRHKSNMHQDEFLSFIYSSFGPYFITKKVSGWDGECETQKIKFYLANSPTTYFEPDQSVFRPKGEYTIFEDRVGQYSRLPIIKGNQDQKASNEIPENKVE